MLRAQPESSPAVLSGKPYSPGTFARPADRIHSAYTLAASVGAALPCSRLQRKDRVVFNIAGNKYRLIVAVKYDLGIVYVRFVGTHGEYDRLNVAEV